MHGAAHQAVEHITLWTLLWASVSMAVKDCIGTLLNIAENRGRAMASGLLDGASDLAVLIVNVVGAGSIVIYGWNIKTISVLAIMMATSTVGTYYWTKLAHRISPAPRMVTWEEHQQAQAGLASLRDEFELLRDKVGTE